MPGKYVATNKEALDSGLIDVVMPAATELANIRVSKVVLIRSEQHAVLSMPEFLELFNENWRFVVKCEVMARKMIVGLRGVMVSQACVLIHYDEDDFNVVRTLILVEIIFIQSSCWSHISLGILSRERNMGPS